MNIGCQRRVVHSSSVSRPRLSLLVAGVCRIFSILTNADNLPALSSSCAASSFVPPSLQKNHLVQTDGFASVRTAYLPFSSPPASSSSLLASCLQLVSPRLLPPASATTSAASVQRAAAPGLQRVPAPHLMLRVPPGHSHRPPPPRPRSRQHHLQKRSRAARHDVHPLQLEGPTAVWPRSVAPAPLPSSGQPLAVFPPPRFLHCHPLPLLLSLQHPRTRQQQGRADPAPAPTARALPACAFVALPARHPSQRQAMRYRPPSSRPDISPCLLRACRL